VKNAYFFKSGGWPDLLMVNLGVERTNGERRWFGGL